MPIVEPFRALRFAAGDGDLQKLIAPPYDVISPERRKELGARHAHNIVHLDLPRPADGGDPHRHASALLRRWIADGVLVRDPRPAFYACEQHYRVGDEVTRVRRGLFARLRLEPLSAGGVIPHERTLDAPRRDRQSLLAATRTNLSAVFFLHPDPGSEISGRLSSRCGSGPAREVRDDDGTLIRLTRIDGEAEVAFLRERLSDGWVLIADGHHRYESALAYRDERREGGSEDAEHALAFLCSLEDPGLSVFPIHRAVHSVHGFDPARLRRTLSDCFRLTAMPDRAALSAAVRARRGASGVFGLASREERPFWLAEWKEGTGFDRPGMAEIPEPLRRLDVILLHRLVLEQALGISLEAQAQQSNLEYLKDEETLFSRVTGGRAQLGILLNPTRVEQVVEVSRARLRLPQKSTFFHPKVPTGLVLNPLDD